MDDFFILAAEFESKPVPHHNQRDVAVVGQKLLVNNDTVVAPRANIDSTPVASGVTASYCAADIWAIGGGGGEGGSGSSR